MRYRISHPGYPWHGHEFEADDDATIDRARVDAEDIIHYDYLPELDFEIEEVRDKR